MEFPTREEYLKMAEETEAKAQQAITEAIRDGWLKIARCYRQLADEASSRPH